MTGDKLKEIRIKLGDNQKVMSTKLGITQSYYSALERGEKAITTKVLDKLINNVGVSSVWWYSSNGSIFSSNLSGKNVGEMSGDNAKDWQNAIQIHLGQKADNLEFIRRNMDLLRETAQKKIKYNELFFKRLTKDAPKLKELYNALIIIDEFPYTLSSLENSKVGKALDLFRTFLNDPNLTIELPPVNTYSEERLKALKELEPYLIIFKNLATHIREFQKSMLEVGKQLDYKDDFNFEEEPEPGN